MAISTVLDLAELLQAIILISLNAAATTELVCLNLVPIRPRYLIQSLGLSQNSDFTRWYLNHDRLIWLK
ncbi:hypothetical protein OGAPHI_003801 [Ogataea philodendri]|uniref:Uncharacterized protein n=1 Tax=Ogataea philodendri TaxID=1378263 RepID=A0A9P8T461_9ASCO|nr:uncharacterized protein OGAPHI_003801 [Ogataea philodendri]KAH3665613.1 hypothetical protein OGAPHI_003801 [Ogataea philodendri]